VPSGHKKQQEEKRMKKVLATTIAALSLAAVIAIPAGAATTAIVPSGSAGASGPWMNAISQDGRFVVFYSSASLVPSDTNGYQDVYLYDRTTKKYELISVSSTGQLGNGDSTSQISISPNGRFVAFESTASNLVDGLSSGPSYLYVRDRLNSKTILAGASRSGIPADNYSYHHSFSTDGRFLAFSSSATNLIDGQSNTFQTYLKDLVTGDIRIISTAQDGTPTPADSSAYSPFLSGNAGFVCMSSYASNMYPGIDYTYNQMVVKNLGTGKVELVSFDYANPTIGGNNYTDQCWMNNDGRFVLYRADASNLVSDDTNGVTDLFLYDRTTQINERVNLFTGGVQMTGGLGYRASLSNDGRFIAFEYTAANASEKSGIYVYDRQTKTLEPVSVSVAGATLPGHEAWISNDGSTVAFMSDQALVTTDTNGVDDMYVRDRSALTITKATLDYVADSISVEATSTLGKNDAVTVTDPALGTMTWNNTTSKWTITKNNQTIPPASITIMGKNGSKTIQ
jgi:WD40-like Beta Propeller Repeat